MIENFNDIIWICFTGQKFAMLEMKIVISQLLLKYQFLPAMKSEPLILDTSLVIRSINRLPVRIKRRSSENIWAMFLPDHSY